MLKPVGELGENMGDKGIQEIHVYTVGCPHSPNVPRVRHGSNSGDTEPTAEYPRLVYIPRCECT